MWQTFPPRKPARRSRSVLIAGLAVGLCALAALAPSRHAAPVLASPAVSLFDAHSGNALSSRRVPAASPPALAQVHYIYRQLAVEPPHRGRVPGRVKMPLFTQYDLLTGAGDKASYRFRDGTTVKMNEATDALLASSYVTLVQHGEVAQYVAPGTRHLIVTRAGLAGSIGTVYDVKVVGNTSTFVVLRGSLQVTNASGSVVIKRNQQTVVTQHRTPGRPTPVDAEAVFAWADQIPTPDLGEDVALDGNGGKILRVSSQRSNPRWHAGHLIDGLRSLGWESASGRVQGESVTIGFSPSRLYRIFEVILDPASTGGDSPTMDLKDFEIRVSSTGQAATDLTTIFTGTCAQSDRLQLFKLPVPVLAKYVELVVRSNYGSRRGVAVAEFEAVANVAGLAYPAGIATDRGGNLYLADTGNDRIQKLSPQGVPLVAWGVKGSGPAQFRSPDGLALDGQGNIFVADTHNNRIQKLSPRGKPLAQWGTYGSGPGQFSLPEDVALDGRRNIYVTDSGNNRIQKLSPGGRPLAQWGASGQFDRPVGIALDRHGNVYVADYGHARIQKFSPQGRPLAQWGSFGSGRRQLNRPEGLALDRAGDVYVADTGNHRIVELSPQGRPLAIGPSHRQVAYITPGRVTVGARGHVYASDFANSHILELGPQLRLRGQLGVFGTIPQLLASPHGVAVDPRGDVYITDPLNGRIQKRSPTGHVLAAFGTRAFLRQHTEANLRPGQFIVPRGIAVDRRGNIYVADRGQIQRLSDRGPIKRLKVAVQDWIAVDRTGNLYVFDKQNLIRKLSPNGTWLATLGAGGQFNRPEGLAIDGRGDIYAVDTGNRRVVKLSPAGDTLGALGTAAGLNGAQGVAVDTQGNVYVADTGNNRVAKLSSSGDLLASFGSGVLHRPLGVGVDRQGHIYVADADDDRIVELSPTGQVLASWT